jgi:capsular exopolysaccharide synthesis family protein
MSRIFDALLRSEAERSGVDVSRLAGATELLEQAERHAASDVAEPVAGNGAVPGSDHDAAGRGDSPEGGGSVPTGYRTRDAYNDVQTIDLSPELTARLVSVSEQDGPAAEAFRFLGVRLRHMRKDRVLKKLLITSSIPQEGKSLVSSNLACTLSLRSPQRTLLLEGDFRRPSLTQLFGLAGKPGVCEWLREERDLAECMYQIPNPCVWILPAGSSSGNYLELLQSGRISRLLAETSEAFDWIIIDSPPVLPLADTSIWSRLADGILLVTRQGKTEKRQLMRGLDVIEKQKLIGAVLNSSSGSAHGDYYYTQRKTGGGSELSGK